jgi:hypothetical protein
VGAGVIVADAGAGATAPVRGCSGRERGLRRRLWRCSGAAWRSSGAAPAGAPARARPWRGRGLALLRRGRSCGAGAALAQPGAAPAVAPARARPGAAGRGSATTRSCGGGSGAGGGARRRRQWLRPGPREEEGAGEEGVFLKKKYFRYFLIELTCGTQSTSANYATSAL